MGDLQQLEAQLRKLVELRPDQAAFKAELVKFYVAHQRVDEAEKLMRSIAAANPANTAAELERCSLSVRDKRLRRRTTGTR